MRIAIIDDEQVVIEQLTGFIKRAESELNMQLEAFPFLSGESFISGYDFSFDIVLLDIEIGAENGMDIARKLREMDKNVTLMFITNMSQYAVQGYLVDAVDFVVKPVDYDSFLFRIKRAISRATIQSGKLIKLNSGSDIFTFPSSEIIYIEIQGHNMTIHSQNGVQSLRSSLRTVEKQLSGAPFSRCNNSFLVNLNHIRSIVDNNITMSNRDVLTISRGKKASFMNAYSRFIGGII